MPESNRAPVVVAEFRATHSTGGGPDKTIMVSAAGHDPARVRIVPLFLAQGNDPLPGVRALAAQTGVEPIIVPDRGPLDLGIVRRVRRLVREHGCRVIHAHDFKTDVYALLVAAGMPGLVALATAHGWSRPLDAKHRLYNLLDRQALRRYPTVLTVSRQTAERLASFGVNPERIRVVPNGVDLHRWGPPSGPGRWPADLPRGRRLVGTVGRLSIDKNMDALLEAFLLLAPRHADVDLVLVGDGPERARLEAKARAVGAGDRIRFLGLRSDLPDLYAAMEIFVLSSRTEGMPNTLLEAMAMGRPVVATPVGGVGELVRDGREGLLVPPGDVGALASSLETLLGDGERARVLGEGARRRIETEFSMKHRLRRMEEIYESVAGP